MESPSSNEETVIIFNDNTEIMENSIDLNEKQLFSDASSTKRNDDDNCSSSTVAISGSLVDTECSISISSSCDLAKELPKGEENTSTQYSRSIPNLRLKYLSVTLVIMLADGLQGTHLYVLYDGYGFNVASLYALGFITGALTTPITGPLIDRFGRKKCAMLYCALEVGINLLEQYPFLSGLLISRMVGGITTNLLSSVFEAWLDTEFRNCCRTPERIIDNVSISDDETTSFIDDDEEESKIEYELIMRDSIIVSNLASIASGYLAHMLAEKYGPSGPFQGAVSCTSVALVIISLLWTENYGTSSTNDSEQGADDDLSSHANISCGERSTKSVVDYMTEATTIFRSNPKILCLGVIQGLSAGSLQLFIFLWSPTLQIFTSGNNSSTNTHWSDSKLSLKPYFEWAIDGMGNPAYGLIFGAFMAAGVSGGLCAPYIRRAARLLFSKEDEPLIQGNQSKEAGIKHRPMELEFLTGINYIFSAILMLVPLILSTSSNESFSIALLAFLTYEFLMGITMPCEGVIRSIYLPADGRASLTMVPRMVVNLAVSLGVLLTKYIPERKTFIAIAFLMMCSGFLQLSFISRHEWTRVYRKLIRHARGLSISTFLCPRNKGDDNESFNQKDDSSVMRKQKAKID